MTPSPDVRSAAQVVLRLALRVEATVTPSDERRAVDELRRAASVLRSRLIASGMRGSWQTDPKVQSGGVRR